MAGELRAHVRAHPNLLRKIGGIYDGKRPISIAQVLDEVTAVDAFSKLLIEGIESVTTSDGRLDTKDLAAFVLRRMKENQR